MCKAFLKQIIFDLFQLVLLICNNVVLGVKPNLKRGQQYFGTSSVTLTISILQFSQNPIAVYHKNVRKCKRF